MLKLRDVMSREVVALSPDTSLIEAIELFAERHISGAPVMQGDRIVGVLSSTDILEFVASNPAMIADFGDGSVDAGSWSALAGHVVGEAMSGGPACTLSVDATVQAAADLMRQANIHRVFVTEHDRVVGVVSSLDITRALADHKVGARTFVFPGRTSIV